MRVREANTGHRTHQAPPHPNTLHRTAPPPLPTLPRHAVPHHTTPRHANPRHATPPPPLALPHRLDPPRHASLPDPTQPHPSPPHTPHTAHHTPHTADRTGTGTAPHRTAPHRTAPHPTPLHHTPPHRRWGPSRPTRREATVGMAYTTCIPQSWGQPFCPHLGHKRDHHAVALDHGPQCPGGCGDARSAGGRSDMAPPPRFSLLPPVTSTTFLPRRWATSYRTRLPFQRGSHMRPVGEPTTHREVASPSTGLTATSSAIYGRTTWTTSQR